MDGEQNHDEFIESVIAACARARIETLEAGVPVFYRDFALGFDVMEQPNGTKYEIHFIPGAPGDRNYEVIREINQISD